MRETVLESTYAFSLVGTSRCDVRAACSGATRSNASVVRLLVPPATTRAGTARRAIPTLPLNTYESTVNQQARKPALLGRKRQTGAADCLKKARSDPLRRAEFSNSLPARDISKRFPLVGRAFCNPRWPRAAPSTIFLPLSEHRRTFPHSTACDSMAHSRLALAIHPRFSTLATKAVRRHAESSVATAASFRIPQFLHRCTPYPINVRGCQQILSARAGPRLSGNSARPATSGPSAVPGLGREASARRPAQLPEQAAPLASPPESRRPRQRHGAFGAAAWTARRRRTAPGTSNQPLRCVQKKYPLPRKLSGQRGERPLRAGGRGPGTELARSEIVDHVQCERDNILFATGSGNCPAIRPVARQTVVPAHFTSADYVLPQCIIDRARPAHQRRVLTASRRRVPGAVTGAGVFPAPGKLQLLGRLYLLLVSTAGVNGRFGPSV